VLLENRPNAFGNIGMGMGMASRVPADGSTLLMTSSAFFINPGLYKTVPYDPEREFADLKLLVNINCVDTVINDITHECLAFFECDIDQFNGNLACFYL